MSVHHYMLQIKLFETSHSLLNLLNSIKWCCNYRKSSSCFLFSFADILEAWTLIYFMDLWWQGIGQVQYNMAAIQVNLCSEVFCWRETMIHCSIHLLFCLSWYMYSRLQMAWIAFEFESLETRCLFWQSGKIIYLYLYLYI